MTDTDTARYMFHCKNCGHAERHDFAVVSSRRVGSRVVRTFAHGDGPKQERFWECPECGVTGFYYTARPIMGKYNPDHVCNDDCRSAIGTTCNCACGGANHGAYRMPKDFSENRA